MYLWICFLFTKLRLLYPNCVIFCFSHSCKIVALYSSLWLFHNFFDPFCIKRYMVLSKYLLFKGISWRMSLVYIVWHLCEYICTVNYSSKTIRSKGMCIVHFHRCCQIALQNEYRKLHWCQYSLRRLHCVDFKVCEKTHSHSTRYFKTKDFSN